MNDALDALIIVAWGRLNDGLISDEEFLSIKTTLEALREGPLEITA